MFYIHLNISGIFDWRIEILVNGFLYPLLGALLGRVLVIDFGSLIFQQIFKGSRKLQTIILAVNIKQSFQFLGLIILIQVESQTSFWLSLLFTNIIEMFGVFLNFKRIQSEVRCFKRSKTSSMEIEKSSSKDNKKKNLLSLWMSQLRVEAKIKFFLICYGEELGDKLNSFVVSVVCICMAMWVRDDRSVEEIAFRGFAIFLFELFETTIKK